MGQLNMRDFGGMRRERSLAPRRQRIDQQGMGGFWKNVGRKMDPTNLGSKSTGRGGVGGGGAPSFSAPAGKQGNPDVYLSMDDCAARNDPRRMSNAQAIRLVQDRVFNAGVALSKAMGEVELLERSADKLVALAPDSDEVYAAQQEIADARTTIQTAIDKNYQSKQDMLSADRQMSAAGHWCYYTPHPATNQFIARMGTISDEAASSARTAISRADLRGIGLRMKQALRQAQAEAQKASDAQAAATKLAQIEQAKLDAQAAREEREYQAQLRREEQERIRQDEQRRQEMEYQQAAAAQAEAQRQREIEREDAARAREDAEARRREEAEARREELAVAAENRKFAQEQERELRREERELRKQEREGELQRLMLMQELASKGVPMDFGPPGAAATAPQLPAAAAPSPFGFPGFPGYAQAAPAAYPAAPSGFPGYAPQAPVMPAAPAGGWGAPAMQAPPPGYAASPPQAPPAYQQGGALPAYRQGGATAIPGAAPPQGMQWASFDPASEMFGMGALIPTSNPHLRGARIEEGYILTGSGDNFSIIEARTNRAVNWRGKKSFTLDELFEGAIADGRKGIIYTPPGESPQQQAARLNRERAAAEQEQDAAFNRDVAQGVFGTLTAGVQAAGDYFTAREYRKAGRQPDRGPRLGPVAYSSRPRSSGAGPILMIGAMGVGAVILAAATRKGKKKKGK